MIEQKNIAVVHGVLDTRRVLVQFDVQLEQFAGRAKRPDAKIVDPKVDLRIFRIDSH